MKKQKLISVLLTASMVAGISLTGCGNKAENTADTTAAKEAAGASADTKADNGETVTVTLGYWGDLVKRKPTKNPWKESRRRFQA